MTTVRLVGPSGNMYTGQPHPLQRISRFISDAGHVYYGNFSVADGKLGPTGVIQYKDRRTYIGQFANGSPEGIGVERTPSGLTYAGEVVDGRRKGLGVAQWSEGDRYEGKWLNDKRHEIGKQAWSNAREYYGEWSEHVKHGRGVVIDMSNGDEKTAHYWAKDRDTGKPFDATEFTPIVRQSQLVVGTIYLIISHTVCSRGGCTRGSRESTRPGRIHRVIYPLSLSRS